MNPKHSEDHQVSMPQINQRVSRKNPNLSSYKNDSTCNMNNISQCSLRESINELNSFLADQDIVLPGGKANLK
jgi:hypothetical protein